MPGTSSQQHGGRTARSRRSTSGSRSATSANTICQRRREARRRRHRRRVARAGGAIERFLLGSVSEHVVRHAPCPVLVVTGNREPSESVAAHQLPAQAVALAVGVLPRTARGGAARAAAPGGRAARPRRARRGRGGRATAWSSARKPGRDRRERAAEPERGRGEQQVLHRGKIDDGDRRLEPALDVGAHDDVHRRGRDAAGRAARRRRRAASGSSRVSENARPCVFPRRAG